MARIRRPMKSRRPENWAFERLPGDAKLEPGDYLFCDPLVLMPDAFRMRFAQFMEQNDAREGALVSLGEFRAYCRQLSFGPGEFFIRTPLPQESSAGGFQVGRFRLERGFVGCIPKRAAIALARRERALLKQSVPFSASDWFRPVYRSRVYVILPGSGIAASRPADIRERRARAGKRLEEACRRALRDGD